MLKSSADRWLSGYSISNVPCNDTLCNSSLFILLPLTTVHIYCFVITCVIEYARANTAVIANTRLILDLLSRWPENKNTLVILTPATRDNRHKSRSSFDWTKGSCTTCCFQNAQKENWKKQSKLTKGKSQDDDAELNSKQEEAGDFPQHLKTQQTSPKAPNAANTTVCYENSWFSTVNLQESVGHVWNAGRAFPFIHDSSNASGYKNHRLWVINNTC